MYKVYKVCGVRGKSTGWLLILNGHLSLPLPSSLILSNPLPRAPSIDPALPGGAAGSDMIHAYPPLAFAAAFSLIVRETVPITTQGSNGTHNHFFSWFF